MIALMMPSPNFSWTSGGSLPDYEGRDWCYKSPDPNSKVPPFTFGERRTVDDISDKTVRALATAWVHLPSQIPHGGSSSDLSGD
ncbi:hypothetical protein DIE14_32515 [Burkholderia sp. Bp9017]|nr:hypothetical protein DIE14_32515 [Burkholderia sp. Bp9017]RQZ27416.1 hypothetical protein DIE13_29275 [Burkholderia sp. Bp9016]